MMERAFPLALQEAGLAEAGGLGLRAAGLIALDPWLVLACVVPALMIGAAWRPRRTAALRGRAARRHSPDAEVEAEAPPPAGSDRGDRPAAEAGAEGVLLPCRWQREDHPARHAALMGWRCRVCGESGFTADNAPPVHCRRSQGGSAARAGPRRGRPVRPERTAGGARA